MENRTSKALWLLAYIIFFVILISGAYISNTEYVVGIKETKVKKCDYCTELQTVKKLIQEQNDLIKEQNEILRGTDR